MLAHLIQNLSAQPSRAFLWSVPGALARLIQASGPAVLAHLIQNLSAPALARFPEVNARGARAPDPHLSASGARAPDPDLSARGARASDPYLSARRSALLVHAAARAGFALLIKPLYMPRSRLMQKLNAGGARAGFHISASGRRVPDPDLSVGCLRALDASLSAGGLRVPDTASAHAALAPDPEPQLATLLRLTHTSPRGTRAPAPCHHP